MKYMSLQIMHKLLYPSSILVLAKVFLSILFWYFADRIYTLLFDLFPDHTNIISKSICPSIYVRQSACSYVILINAVLRIIKI